MRINNFIVSFKEKIKDCIIDDSKIHLPKNAIMRFVSLLDDVDDARLQGMIEYPLKEIILIAFLSTLSGADSWPTIASYGKKKIKWLKKFLPFKNGTPAHDTFRRVFSLIDPSQLEKATTLFVTDFFEKVKKIFKIEFKGKDQICVDGKVECGSGRKYHTSEEVKQFSLLHVYDASNEICLYSKFVDVKTNEIPVAQEVMETLYLNGKIVTFDALHTQVETIRIIRKRMGDYVGAVKTNQETLFGCCVQAFTSDKLDRIRKTSNYIKSETDKQHRQIETREYFKVDAKNLEIDEKWIDVRSVICYIKKMYDYVTKETKKEMRIYITSLTDLETISEAIRNHWSVENKLHWHLDVTFGEDANKTMDKAAFTNLSLMNKMCLSLLKLIQPRYNIGLKSIKKLFGWETDGMIRELLSYYSRSEIKNALTLKDKK